MTRGAKTEVTCRCGAKFTARVADRKRGWAKFCSKSCKAKEQERRTGQYTDYIHSKRTGGEIVFVDRNGRYEGFSGHNFSNEEHDCNKGDE